MRRSADNARVSAVVPGSPAARAGIRPGAVLLEANGRPVRDVLDYRFFAADGVADVLVLQDRNVRRIRLDPAADAGLEFEPMAFRACGNRCVFCFSDQNPKGMRKSLYFKDEDYRLSFLFGNYVALTAVDGADLQRIEEQRLSPLFISVHAVDPRLRRKLLGLRRDDGLLDKIRRLAGRGIEMHGQIVLCPGLNDGDSLEETVHALAAFYPNFHSLAVVPVGLTRHRKGLARLRRFNGAAADALVKRVRPWQRAFRRKWKEPFVYLSDEFYLLAGMPFPPPRHYGDFWQSDNGIGMTVKFLERFRRSARAFPRRLPEPERWVLVTGALAAPVLERNVLPALNRIADLRADTLAVRNRFYGDGVTVSGLLTGRDIADALAGSPPAAVALLPPNCLNADGLFLDDWTVDRLSGETGRRIRVVEEFTDLWETA